MPGEKVVCSVVNAQCLIDMCGYEIIEEAFGT